MPARDVQPQPGRPAPRSSRSRRSPGRSGPRSIPLRDDRRSSRAGVGEVPFRISPEELDPLVEAKAPGTRPRPCASKKQRGVFRSCSSGAGLRSSETHLGPRVERVRPFVHRGDPGADHHVAAAGRRRSWARTPGRRGRSRPGSSRASASGARERQRPVTEREHHVLARGRGIARPRRRGRSAGWVRARRWIQPTFCRHAPFVPAERLLDRRRLGQDLRDARVVAAPDRPEERRRAAARPGVELGEGRPVGRQEVRLGLGPEDGLAEVPRVAAGRSTTGVLALAP